MNIRKEITDIVLNKYGHTILDPLSIKTQMGKLWEEFEELNDAKTIEQVECELGDVLFVEQTLQILLDNYLDEYDDWFDLPSKPKLCEISKGLNKCDREIVHDISNYVTQLYLKYDNNYFHKLTNARELLERTIIKNQGRSGKIINGCYVKSEDIK